MTDQRTVVLNPCPHAGLVNIGKAPEPILYECTRDGAWVEWEECAGCLGVDPGSVEVVS